MFIQLQASTTKQEAIDMAFEFADALRKAGWPESDGKYAEALWVGDEFKTKNLYPYLLFAFRAGYYGEPKPTVEALEANGTHKC